MAELIRRKPLFPGKTHANQVQLIFEVMGFDQVADLGFPVSSEAAAFLTKRCRGQAKDLWDVMPEASDEAVCFIETLLEVNPRLRPTAIQALELPYLTDADVLCDYSNLRLVMPPSRSFKFESVKMTLDELKDEIHSELFTALPPGVSLRNNQPLDTLPNQQPRPKASESFTPAGNETRFGASGYGTPATAPDSAYASSKLDSHSSQNTLHNQTLPFSQPNSARSTSAGAFESMNIVRGYAVTDRLATNQHHTVADKNVAQPQKQALASFFDPGPALNRTQQNPARPREQAQDEASFEDDEKDEYKDASSTRDSIGALPEPRKHPSAASMFEPRADRFSFAPNKGKISQTMSSEETGRNRSSSGSSGFINTLQAFRSTFNLGGSSAGGSVESSTEMDSSSGSTRTTTLPSSTMPSTLRNMLSGLSLRRQSSSKESADPNSDQHLSASGNNEGRLISATDGNRSYKAVLTSTNTATARNGTIPSNGEKTTQGFQFLKRN